MAYECQRCHSINPVTGRKIVIGKRTWANCVALGVFPACTCHTVKSTVPFQASSTNYVSYKLAQLVMLRRRCKDLIPLMREFIGKINGKKCGHGWCQLTTSVCCACGDQSGGQFRYVDGKGRVPCSRDAHYCPGCKW